MRRIKKYMYILTFTLLVLSNSIGAYAAKGKKNNGNITGGVNSSVGATATTQSNKTYKSDPVNAVTSVAQSNCATIAGVANTANSKVGNVKILIVDTKEATLTFDNAAYLDLDSDQKREFMETALGGIKESQIGKTTKNKIYNFIASQDESVSSAIKYLKNDTSADFIEARKWFAPFSGPISTLMGVLCIMIFSFLALSVVFDICFLVIPLFRMLLEKGEDNKRPFGVSVEAWNTVREVESSGKGDIMRLYIKKRIPIFILVSMILGWLISGKIYDIVVYFMDAFHF